MLRKLPLIALFIHAGAVGLFGQGQVNLANRLPGVLSAPFYGLEPCPCTRMQITGNTASGNPAGCRVYSGALLSGAGYTAALFAGPLGSAPHQLRFADATIFQTTGAGFIVAKTVTVPGINPGQRATFQVRAWDNRGGTITTWEQAVANSTVALGASALFSPPEPLGGTDGQGNIYQTLNLVGLTSFNLILPSASTSCQPLCQPQSQAVEEGARVEFCFQVCGSSCNYQWFFNDAPIRNATNSMLVLTNATRYNAGIYYALADGVHFSDLVFLDVFTNNFVLRSPRVAGSLFRFDLSGPIGCVYAIDGSANLIGWTQVAIVTNSTGTITFQDPVTSNPPWRFYRVRLRQ